MENRQYLESVLISDGIAIVLCNSTYTTVNIVLKTTSTVRQSVILSE